MLHDWQVCTWKSMCKGTHVTSFPIALDLVTLLISFAQLSQLAKSRLPSVVSGLSGRGRGGKLWVCAGCVLAPGAQSFG